MSKVVKNLMISEIRQRVGEYREVLVLDASKVNAVAANKLRLTLRKKGIRLLGVKNAVARKALSDLGLTGLGAVLTGPSTIAFGGEDIVALSRELAEHATQIKELEIKGGAIGATSLTAKNVEDLSKSKGRAELLSDLVAREILSAVRQSDLRKIWPQRCWDQRRSRRRLNCDQGDGGLEIRAGFAPAGQRCP